VANILLVEDNADLAFGLAMNLEQEGYRVTVASDGAQAIRHCRNANVSLVILDLMLPDMSGLEVLRALRSAHHDCAIIVLTARTGESDRVSALRLDADDYVTKPFSLLELLERVRLRLRDIRSSHAATGLEIDAERRWVAFRGQEVRLTAKEFDLLCALAEARGAVLSKDRLLADVWRLPVDVRSRTVDSHVVTLRRKLRKAGVPDLIRTVHGRGFAWVPIPPSPPKAQ